jgi:hypothetical protein
MTRRQCTCYGYNGGSCDVHDPGAYEPERTLEDRVQDALPDIPDRIRPWIEADEIESALGDDATDEDYARRDAAYAKAEASCPEHEYSAWSRARIEQAAYWRAQFQDDSW